MVRNVNHVSDEQVTQITQTGSQQVVCHLCKEEASSKTKFVDHLRVDHHFHASVETESFSLKEGK